MFSTANTAYPHFSGMGKRFFNDNIIKDSRQPYLSGMAVSSKKDFFSSPTKIRNTKGVQTISKSYYSSKKNEHPQYIGQSKSVESETDKYNK